MNYTADVESLTVKMSWQALSDKFQPEKIILMYSENNQTYRFVNKYCKK